MSIIPMRRMCLWCLVMKKRSLLHASMFVTIVGIILIPKNEGKKRFSYQANASMSSIRKRRMYLWCLIVKKRRFLCASMFVTIDEIALNPKNGGRKSFFYQSKASMSSFPMTRMFLWCPIMKKK